MRLRYLTAGESHGQALVGILDGLPAGLSLTSDRDIDPVLRERQKGYGRSHRQKIEQDTAHILSGVRFGMTTGAPVALIIQNKDWQNWQSKMSVTPVDTVPDPVTIPRPGHADLAGAIKYAHTGDLRNVFDRASARETAMRVGLGAIATKLLLEIGITSVSYVRSIGTIDAGAPPNDVGMIQDAIRTSEVRSFAREKEMKEEIDTAKKNGDTLGGVVEVQFHGLPVGLGSTMQWDRKLDAEIAKAVMSIQAVKSVEIGDGAQVGGQLGSESHDALSTDGVSLRRNSNHAGGLEGGMSNGEPLIVRATMKPISTLMQPLSSVDLASGKPTTAHIERSDVCAVPALSVIVAHVVALTMADAVLDTFGGDTMEELRERVEKRRLTYATLLKR